MKGMLIPTNGNPVEIDIEVDETGSTLHDLQRLVGGNIEPFDVIFGEGISLYVNEEGLFTCPPNRAVYATKGMEEAGYLSMMDYTVHRSRRENCTPSSAATSWPSGSTSRPERIATSQPMRCPA